MAGTHPMLGPFRPTAMEPFDRLRAAHLLNRAGFGGTPDEIEKIIQLGPQGAVDWLLDFPDAGAADQHPPDGPDLSAVAPYAEEHRELAKMFLGKGEAEIEAQRSQYAHANHDGIVSTVQWWLARMGRTPHPLQEKLALFWHGHFTTSINDEYIARLIWRQNELLRRMAAGNFRPFVKAICRDPAMLDYLNNSENVKQHPNENFARELMELYTVGLGQYSEQDVREAARAFTGWGHDGKQFAFHAADHDDGEKTFLGQRGKLDGDDVADRLCDHPACPRFIAARLFRFFAYENEVEPAVIDGLADVFRESKLELRPLLRAILTSRAFYSEAAIGTQIKSPVQLLVGTVRLLGLQTPPWKTVRVFLKDAGQLPFLPPDPRGWLGGRTWINTSTLTVRYNLGVWLAGGEVPPLQGEGGLREKTVAGIGAERRIEAERIIDLWVRRLIQRPIDAAQRRVLIAALGSTPDREDELRKLVQLIVSMPEYQLC